MIKLYEVPIAWEAIQAALAETGGEMTPELEALWGALQEEGPQKIENAAIVLKHFQASAEAIKAESDRLAARAKALENAADRLKSLLIPALEALGGKVKTDRFTVYTQRRKSYAIELAPGCDVWCLPERFYRTREPELVKTEIKKALEAGEEMPADLVIQETESVWAVVR